MNAMNTTRSGLTVTGAALLVTLLLALAIPTPASAFSLVGAGPRFGVTDPDGVDGALQVGAGLDFEQSGTRIHLVPSLLYWNESDISDINPNFDVMYHFNSAGRIGPYLGGGLGIHAYSQDGPGDPGTDVGANLFGGVLFPSRGATFFMEGRAVLADRDQIGLLGGVNLFLGR
jgi:hypothetical protein